ncbi:hypothetical protein HJ588_18195 [Flexivirga sp. ID2601S]|uniref:Glycosyltransferase RgtA/B/C/D-like domain-containing protein n=1 Tax=Flexivirga aerilata TaxID=1656889 RepID=A0A849ALB6_9MICO|nr:hypothetical protein [Flexivirga aerilata]NNG41195.1 hypothetical protein [Flexivirga aerilata]
MPVSVARRLRLIAHSPATYLVLIALVPLLLAYLRTAAHGWSPEGDDAVIADRIRMVFSTNPPVMGQNSTSGLQAGKVDSHHPGPLEFYLAAPVALLFGFHNLGILTAVVVLNGLAIAGTVLIAWRLRGPRTAIPIVAAVVVLQWVLGPEVLVRPLNTYVAALPALLVLVSAWAVLDGYLAMLWVYVVSASYVAQANLAFTPFVVGLSVVLALVGLVRVLRRHDGPGRSPDARRRSLRAWAIAGGVLLLVWLPSLLELVLYSPNNLAQLWRYRSESQADGTPWSRAFAYPLGQLGSLGFGRFTAGNGATRGGLAASCGAVLLVLTALGAFGGRKLPHTAGSTACGVALAAVAAETWGLTYMAGIPVAYWTMPVFAIGVFLIAALAIRGWELAPEHVHRFHLGRTGWASVAAGGVLVAVFASVGATPPNWTAMDRARTATDRLIPYLTEHVAPGSRVKVGGDGLTALTMNSAVGFQLDRRGYHAYYLLARKTAEDTDDYHVDRADRLPPDAYARVSLVERTSGGGWSSPQPPGSQAVDLVPADAGGPAVRAFVTVPDQLRP